MPCILNSELDYFSVVKTWVNHYILSPRFPNSYSYCLNLNTIKYENILLIFLAPRGLGWRWGWGLNLGPQQLKSEVLTTRLLRNPPKLFISTFTKISLSDAKVSEYYSQILLLKHLHLEYQAIRTDSCYLPVSLLGFPSHLVTFYTWRLFEGTNVIYKAHSFLPF